VWQIFIILLLVLFKLLKVLVPFAPDFMFVSTTATVNIYIPGSFDCISASFESFLDCIPLN
jgi:hypothetical protein